MAIKICLDAGHYGKYNRSPAVPAYYESDMNWKLHLLLKKYLEQHGFQVITTRISQAADRELYQRGAASKGCALFLSIHSNASGSKVDEVADYVAVYHLTEDHGTDVDDKSKALAAKLAPVIASTMGVKQGGKILTRKASSDKNKDGVLNDNYYGVLNGARQAGTPGLILEHSFHTNTRSTKWLMDGANLDKLAKAEAEVIAAHFGLKKTTRTVYTVTTSRSFDSKAEAEKAVSALRGDGYTVKVAERTVDTPAAEKPATAPVEPVKTIDQVAQEVLQGKWGNGADRKNRLTAAGYDYSAVQKRVNELSRG